MEITGGEVSDFKGFDVLVDNDFPAAKVFLADRGYDSDHIRQTITQRGGTPVIPSKANRKVLIPLDTITYALRNQVERCFNKLKCSRRFGEPRLGDPSRMLVHDRFLVHDDAFWCGWFVAE